MGSKSKQKMDDLVQSVGGFAQASRRLARQAEKQYAPEVENILQTQSRNPRRIEHLLDGLLDFGFDAAVTRLFKKFCRYYLKINPTATASYVHAYCDIWDEKWQAKGEARGVE